MLASFGKPLPAKAGTLIVELERGAAQVAPVVRALDEAGIPVESLELVEPTLDDVFVEKTGEHLEDDETPAPGPRGRGRGPASVSNRHAWRVVFALGQRSVSRPSGARSCWRRC